MKYVYNISTITRIGNWGDIQSPASNALIVGINIISSQKLDKWNDLFDVSIMTFAPFDFAILIPWSISFVVPLKDIAITTL